MVSALAKAGHRETVANESGRQEHPLVCVGVGGGDCLKNTHEVEPRDARHTCMRMRNAGHDTRAKRHHAKSALHVPLPAEEKVDVLSRAYNSTWCVAVAGAAQRYLDKCVFILGSDHTVVIVPMLGRRHPESTDDDPCSLCATSPLRERGQGGLHPLCAQLARQCSTNAQHSNTAIRSGTTQLASPRGCIHNEFAARALPLSTAVCSRERVPDSFLQ
jgi:hypothetical protein